MKTGKNIFKWLHNWMKKKKSRLALDFFPYGSWNRTNFQLNPTIFFSCLDIMKLLASFMPFLFFTDSISIHLYRHIHLFIYQFIYISIFQGLRIYLNQAFKENLHLYLFPRKVTHITNKSNTWTDQWQQFRTPPAPGGGALQPHL